MAEIRPFKGTYYNKELINDLSTVICPPYDIISPKMQQDLYQKSKYNFVRIDHGIEQSGDSESDNKYTRAAANLEQWLKQGILAKASQPAIYMHDHYFNYSGESYKRRGIITDIRVEEWDKEVVRPHESTFGKARNDRIRLLHACQANTSSILSLYKDNGNQIASVLTNQENKEPFISLSTEDGETHHIWEITDVAAIEKIRNSLMHESIYIADGHHRYESALAYMHERHASTKSELEGSPYNYVMMTLVHFSDPGLLILPPHRQVRGVSKRLISQLLAKITPLFEMRELPLNSGTMWQTIDSFLSDDNEDNRMVLSGLSSDSVFLLTLRDPSSVSSMVPFFHTDLYKRLMVSVSDHVILEKMLGAEGEEGEMVIDYTPDMQEALNNVLNQEYQISILLSPIQPETLKDIADSGDRMPKKSTYFYPKVPTGFIINKW